MTHAASRLFRVRMFGQFGVTRAQGSDLTPRSRKTRALLAYCIAMAPGRVSRDRLAGLLWGDRGEDQARASVRQALYELRDLASPDAPLLKADREQVCVDPALMVTELDLVGRAARSGDTLKAASVIGERPAEFLDDLGGISADFDHWLVTERTHARERRRQLALDLARQALAARDFVGARQLALALVAADPLDEAAAVVAMDAIHGLGNREEGHRLFVQLEQSLREELGVAPSDEAVASHARLLNGGGGSSRALAAPATAGAAATAAPSRSERGWSGWRPVIAAAATIAASAALWTLREPRVEQPEFPVTAVLPFESPDGDPQSRLLAATTASAISDALAEMGRSVAVPAVTARLHGPNVQDVARRLKVPYLVRGEVRRSGETMRVAVRLDDINYGVTLLSQSFESPAGEAGGLPDRVAASAGAAIATTDMLHRIDPQGAADPQVATRYLRQVAAIHKGNSMLAYDEARKLMAQRPDSPLAQMALAMTTGFFLPEIPLADRPAAVARARAAARQVRRDAPKFGDAYIPDCLLSPSLWRRQCENSLRYGLSVDAHAPSAEGFLSTLLVEAGRTREAAQLAKASFEVRPFSAPRAGWYLYIAEMLGDETEVAWVTRRTDRYWPDRPQIAESAFLGRIARGAWGEGRDLLQQRPAGFIFLRPDQLHGLTALASNLAGARPDPRQVRTFCATREPPPMAIAGACLAAFAQLGDLDRAFALANRYYPDLRGRSPREETQKWLRHGSPPYETSILFAPVTRAMRADSRFVALAERLRLPEYWRSNGWPDFCKVERAPVCRS